MLIVFFKMKHAYLCMHKIYIYKIIYVYKLYELLQLLKYSYINTFYKMSVKVRYNTRNSERSVN